MRVDVSGWIRLGREFALPRGPLVGDFSRELIRRRFSQPDPDRTSFTAAWPDQPASAYIGRM
jgi:hypothetical protein